MSKFKYYNSLNLFEGVITELQEGNPVQELGSKLGQLFQNNAPLLKSVMNRLRSYPPEVQKKKINIALQTVNNIMHFDPYEVSKAIFSALDNDDKSNGYEAKYANDDASPRNGESNDRRANRPYQPKPWMK